MKLYQHHCWRGFIQRTCPVKSHLGKRIERRDLVNNYEEVDFIIPQQVNNLLEEGKEKLMVLSAATDVFVLLCSHFQKYGWLNASIYMRDPRQNETKTISINETVENHQDLIPSLIGLHTLIGCDSVPSMYGTGKSKGI